LIVWSEGVVINSMVTAVRGEPESGGLELAGLDGPEPAALGVLLLAGVTLAGKRCWRVHLTQNG